MIHRKIVFTSLAGALLLAPGAGLHGQASAPAKVGFVYVSPVGRAGWSYQQDQGRGELEAACQGRIKTRAIAQVAEGKDAETALRQLAADGDRIIFATSAGYLNQTARVAADYPGITFIQAAGAHQGAKLSNMSSYNARFYEGRYLNGVIAGRMTKSNLAGYVAAFPLPEVLQGINAFARGMRSVNPKAEVRVIWVNAWSDPFRDRQAAMALIFQGADMLTHHTDSSEVVLAAEAKHKSRGVWAFSYHSEMNQLAPTSLLTGTMDVWGPTFTALVKQVLAGTWTGAPFWGGFREGVIQLAPLSPAIPPELKAQVAQLQAQIAQGQLHPFAGPVFDQDGKQRVAKGRDMSDAELNAMNYYVQGVVGPPLPGH